MAAVDPYPENGKGWPCLSSELRIKIWKLVYGDQEGRVVEVETAPHAHYDYEHRWCPRSSRSLRPVMVNVCHEARAIAYKLAQLAGHIIFDTSSETNPIYFNREIDTLYVLNTKEYWIRDWGPEGILTQYQTIHSPALLRFLAIDLEPLNRASNQYSLLLDLHHFSALEEMVFLASENSEEAREIIRFMNTHLDIWKKEEDMDPAQRARSRVGEPYRLAIPLRLRECTFARRVGKRFMYFDTPRAKFRSRADRQRGITIPAPQHMRIDPSPLR
jgi:hypothetical protein